MNECRTELTEVPGNGYECPTGLTEVLRRVTPGVNTPGTVFCIHVATVYTYPTEYNLAKLPILAVVVVVVVVVVVSSSLRVVCGDRYRSSMIPIAARCSTSSYNIGFHSVHTRS